MSLDSASSPPRQAPLIAVDVRMWGESGIGRYIREVLPRVIAEWPEARWRLFGSKEDFAEMPAVEKSDWDWPVYSWREHGMPSPRGWSEADMRWVPHFNVTAYTRAPLLVTVHDVLPLIQRAGWRGRMRAVLAGVYMGRVRRRASRVVCPSRFSADGVVAAGGVERARVRVTPLGVSDSFLATGNVSEREPIWLYVGNVKPHKGLATLLEAMRSPQLAGLEHRLVIVGRRDGFFTSAPALLKRADELGSRVQWAGKVDEAALRNWYQRAAVLVMPSTHEGFGLPVLEAMAAGCPVVAARAGALPEVAGEAAWWFEPGDAVGLAARLLELSAGADERGEKVRLGRDRAAEMTWVRTAERTVTELRAWWEGGAR